MRGGGGSTSGGRPTHFLAVRVDGSPRVHAAYETVHGALLRAEPGLRGALVEAASAHVPGGVLRLREGPAAGAAGPGPPLSGAEAVAFLKQGIWAAQEDEAQRGADAPLHTVAAAGAALDALAGSWTEPLVVRLRGLGSFGGQVLYLDVAEGEGREGLVRLEAAARAALAGLGIALNSSGAFTPHVTIAKTSKLKRRGKRGRGRPQGKLKIEKGFYAGLDVDAGPVEVRDLLLCSMAGRRAGEFYVVDHAVPLC